MSSEKGLAIEKIEARRRLETERLRQLPLDERGKLVAAACRAAAEIEASRLRMGMRPLSAHPGRHQHGRFWRRPLAVSETNRPASDPAQAAGHLAAELEAVNCEYALGGAIALGFWAEPRGTLDVDVTLYLPADRPTHCLRLLQQVGCEVNTNEATQSLTEHGYCEVTFGGFRIDVFLPTIEFYEEARQRQSA